MLDPSRPQPPAWATELASGLYSLKQAAKRARTEYDCAASDADDLHQEVSDADDKADATELIVNGSVVHDGFAHHPYTEMLRELALVHSRLALSAAQTWHRSEYAHAYACSSLLCDLPLWPRAVVNSSFTASVVLPSNLPQPMLRHLLKPYRIALTAQAELTPPSRNHNTLPWTRSAQAWQTYAKAAEDQFWALISERAASSR